MENPAVDTKAAAPVAVQQPVIMMVDPGRWREYPPPGDLNDPIAPLGEGDAATFARKPDAAGLKRFLAGYVDRIETHYRSKATPELLAWLAAHPAIRRDFWLALDPTYDEVAAALAILDDLRSRNAKAVETFHHLAIALAVVHDSAGAIAGSTYTAIWGIDKQQFCKPPPYQEIFDHFILPKHLALFPFKPQQMSWSMLVHVADLDLDAEQRGWAIANEIQRRTDIAALYPAVPYDYQKLNTRRSRLGSDPYSLSNLLKIGGVCGDQAHYTSRVAKAFSIPAMKVTGEGRYGAASLHAWAGFLTAKGGRPVLDFTGRYNFDFYYTGEIFDPQTRTRTLDRYVALAYDGASLSFEKMQLADALARAGRACRVDQPAVSLALAKAAVDQNRYSAMAWRLLMEHVAIGTLPRKEAAVYGQRMLTDLAAHPDLTIECLDMYLRSIPETEVDARQKLWTGAYRLYAQRPDLQVALRLRQCRELISAQREQEALTKALETVAGNAKEGSLILPLVELVVASSKVFAASEPKFRLAVVKDALHKVDADFPKQRGSTASPAYADFKTLIDSL